MKTILVILPLYFFFTLSVKRARDFRSFSNAGKEILSDIQDGATIVGNNYIHRHHTLSANSNTILDFSDDDSSMSSRHRAHFNGTPGAAAFFLVKKIWGSYTNGVPAPVHSCIPSTLFNKGSPMCANTVVFHNLDIDKNKPSLFRFLHLQKTLPLISGRRRGMSLLQPPGNFLLSYSQSLLASLKVLRLPVLFEQPVIQNEPGAGSGNAIFDQVRSPP